MWPKWWEAGGLHNEELQNFYTSPNIIMVFKSWQMRLAGHVECNRQMRNGYKILVRKPEKKRPFRRPRHKWEDNIRMDLRDIRWEGVDWIHMVLDKDQCQAVVNTVMNLQVP
jgi:hypothetical protein